MAKKFLYLVAIAIILVLGGAIALNIWSKELTRIAMVPSADFVEQEPFEANSYQDPAKWYSRPGIGVDDPSRWQPALRNERGGSDRLLPDPADPPAPDFAVFFVHPTSYFSRSQWNAPLDDPQADTTARLFLRGLASPFNQASEIWAPKYRQATMGALITDKPEGQRAIDAAYTDVQQAFEFFIGSVDADTPIVLAGHSQGSLHLMQLLQQEIAGSPVASRVVAAYIVGWPVSVDHDLPALGLPACATAEQASCILSWSTFAEPANADELFDYYSASTGLDGKPRGSSKFLCTNPLTGTIDAEASQESNLGALVPEDDLSNGELVPGYVPARCVERGLLLIGPPPEMGNAVLPGNNYHVYDIPLFWRNVQQDVQRRAEQWHQQQE